MVVTQQQLDQIQSGYSNLDIFFIIVPIGAVLALLFALANIFIIRKAPLGTERITHLTDIIARAARSYLKRQYTGVAIFFAVVTVILLLLAYVGHLVSPFTPFAFLTGGFFSGLAGFVGMTVATYSNGRTAYAASQSLNKGLRLAFSSGIVMGFTVVGLGLLDLSIWYYLLKAMPESLWGGTDQITFITSTMLTFGMGASSMALFARVGGGIYTKAADVGADLVGKNEVGIPEDDPRNPAVIADNVGDNVGDVAGMGADLYESYVGSIVACSALAVAAGLGVNGVLLPMAISSVGIVLAIISSFLVRIKENATAKALLFALRKGTWTSALLTAIGSFFLVKFIIVDQSVGEQQNLGGWGYYISILCGLLTGVIIGYVTEYYTSDNYKPTQKLAGSSLTGHATIIIGGIALGMKSTFIPVLTIAASVLISFTTSGGFEALSSGLGSIELNHGLFGIGLSAVGMLSTLGITLATDAYGPVADNAGGIAQMANMDEEVRQRTDALDSLGNTTAATGKGFAIGSAALTGLALISAYIDAVKNIDPDFAFDLSLINPTVLVGLIIGAMLPYLFSAFTMNAVGRAAQAVVVEVRRQFKKIKGLMTGDKEADYEKCVDLCAKAAQKEMILPALTAILAPILGGILLGVNGVVGILAGALSSGFILAIMMSNSGGAWDNAKKYIEIGNHGGKGSDPHKAAVTGDTVGDPFKDTSGPSINILIKLISMVSIVFAGVIIALGIL